MKLLLLTSKALRRIFKNRLRKDEVTASMSVQKYSNMFEQLLLLVILPSSTVCTPRALLLNVNLRVTLFGFLVFFFSFSGVPEQFYFFYFSFFLSFFRKMEIFEFNRVREICGVYTDLRRRRFFFVFPCEIKA